MAGEFDLTDRNQAVEKLLKSAHDQVVHGYVAFVRSVAGAVEQIRWNANGSSDTRFVMYARSRHRLTIREGCDIGADFRAQKRASRADQR